MARRLCGCYSENRAKQHELPPLQVLPKFFKGGLWQTIYRRPGAGWIHLTFCWHLLLVDEHPARISRFYQGNVCSIEPYMLRRFTRQFEYDQLYVWNPNTGLLFSSNIYEGSRALYYIMAGCTCATFSLP